MRNYYEAYDDRYRQIHRENLRWFDDEPSAIVWEAMEKYSVSAHARILEIGCGEGRDARYLLSKGYDVLATDVSPAAVAYCRGQDPSHGGKYAVLDCLNSRLENRFDFIYAVAVVHMLVPQEDRDQFYSFIRDHLTAGGIGLICSMGDGAMERSSDVSRAFDIQERVHERSGRTVQIASTSYRAVSFENFRHEIENNGLQILEMGLTDIRPDYWKIMYAVVKN